MSGFLSAWKNAELPQFSYVILSGYLLLSFLPAQTSQLHFIDPLPVSRRLLALLMVLPALLALSLGLAGGRIGAITMEKSKLPVTSAWRGRSCKECSPA